MKIVLWDVESTGMTGRDEVIQIGGIVTDIDLTPLYTFNKYCYTNVPIHPQATKVHGLTKKIILEESGGEFLEDVLDSYTINGESILEMKDMISVTYNHPFDSRLVNQTLTNRGLVPIDFGKKITTFKKSLTKGRYNLCAMELSRALFKSRHTTKLIEVASKHTGYPLEQIEVMYKNFTIMTKTQVRGGLAHDAFYDAFLIWVILKANKDMIYL